MKVPVEGPPPTIWEYKWAHWLKDINALALEQWEPYMATWHERGAIFESGKSSPDLFEAHIATLMRRVLK